VSEKANNMERTGYHLDHSSPKDDQELQRRSYSEYHPAEYYPEFQSYNISSDVDFSCLEKMLEASYEYLKRNGLCWHSSRRKLNSSIASSATLF
jgi:hypothetical protein